MTRGSALEAGAWWVYLVTCRDGSLYTGLTNDVERRVAAHNAGRGGAYTRSRRPVRVVFVHPCASGTVARRLEVVLKRLRRAQKLRLIAGDAAVLACCLEEVAAMARRAPPGLDRRGPLV